MSYLVNQLNSIGSDRLLNKDYDELRNRIAQASQVAEEYYTYLETVRNTGVNLDSKQMTSYVNKIIAANRSLWKILKIVPYERKQQYRIEKQALIRTLKAQILTQKQKEESESNEPPQKVQKCQT
jgi:hypothetical protein